MGPGPPNLVMHCQTSDRRLLFRIWMPQTRIWQTEKGAPQPAGQRTDAGTLLIDGDRSAFLDLHWDLRHPQHSLPFPTRPLSCSTSRSHPNNVSPPTWPEKSQNLNDFLPLHCLCIVSLVPGVCHFLHTIWKGRWYLEYSIAMESLLMASLPASSKNDLGFEIFWLLKFYAS